MPPYQENANDLERKYYMTYVLYEDQLVLCRSFAQNGKDIQAVLQRGSGGKESAIELTIDPTKIRTLELDSHYFNLPADTVKDFGVSLMAWKFVRRARRQNKKGISTETAWLSSPMQSIFINGHKPCPQLSFDFRVINAMRKPVYPASLAEATTLCQEHNSVALSPDFAIGLSHMLDNDYLLMSKFGFVGSMTTYPHRFRVCHQGSYQEVCDFIRRQGWSNEVQLCQIN